MRRALCLILLISLLIFGSAWKLDSYVQRTALEYLQGLNTVRAALMQNDPEGALREQAYLHALWQHDAHHLNALMDHHHTREMNSLLHRLATALEENDRLNALLLIDELADALEDAAANSRALWEDML